MSWYKDDSLYGMWNWRGITSLCVAIATAIAIVTVAIVVWVHQVSLHAERVKCGNYASLIADRDVRWQYNSYWDQTCLVRLSTGRYVTLSYYLTYFPVDLTGDAGAVQR